MMLPEIFHAFLEQKPVCVLARAVLERLLAPAALDRLFEQTAQQQYTRHLLFSTLVDLMAEVVLKKKPSVFAAYQARRDQLPVSDQAIYDKLQNMEPQVGAAMVRESGRQASDLIVALQATQPPWVPGYRTLIIDGSHLRATEHRLQQLRTTWAAPLPGQGLVVLDQSTQTVSEVLLTENGEAQERSMFHGIHPLIQPRDVWIADRNFCTLGLLQAFLDRGACFVIRQHGALKGELVGKAKEKGRCETGRVLEQKVRFTTSEGRELVLRRITVVLDQPTQDGDTEIHILTNLPVKKATASRVADLYRGRWTIEGLFLQVERTLGCEIKTLAYPQAALFALCIGLLISNAVAVIQGSLRAAHGEKVASELSAYYLTLEIRETSEGMQVAIPAEHWTLFGEMSTKNLATLLIRVAKKMVVVRYRKHPRGPKKPPPDRGEYRAGEHIATSEVLGK